MRKQIVINHCIEKLDQIFHELDFVLSDLNDSITNETKSSVGDKYETSRSMIQMEQEKIHKQKGKFFQMKEIIKKVNPEIEQNQVGLGSLVETTNGWYFVSIALGKIEIEGNTIFCLSPDSPLGNTLRGKKRNDAFPFNQLEFKILDIV
jgi:transcription elongation GreA/GreB family factor